MRVAVSGYVVGYRMRTNPKEEVYGVVDLLQFGSLKADSEVISLLVYDEELRKHLYHRILPGQIRPASFVIELIRRDKGGNMWVAERLIDMRADVAKEEIDEAPLAVEG